MAGPQNAIIGNDFGIDLPETDFPQRDLTDEKKMAKFTRTAEYARQKAWAEAKIKHYQTFLPDGRKLSEAPSSELSAHWIAANEIISVLNEFMTSYELANEIVEETLNVG